MIKNKTGEKPAFRRWGVRLTCLAPGGFGSQGLYITKI